MLSLANYIIEVSNKTTFHFIDKDGKPIQKIKREVAKVEELAVDEFNDGEEFVSYIMPYYGGKIVSYHYKDGRSVKSNKTFVGLKFGQSDLVRARGKYDIITLLLLSADGKPYVKTFNFNKYRYDNNEPIVLKLKKYTPTAETVKIFNNVVFEYDNNYIEKASNINKILDDKLLLRDNDNFKNTVYLVNQGVGIISSTDALKYVNAPKKNKTIKYGHDAFKDITRFKMHSRNYSTVSVEKGGYIELYTGN